MDYLFTMSLDKKQLPSKPFERVIVFVDGGYLRATCKELFGNDDISFESLSKFIVRSFNELLKENPFQANLIRIYYYDGIVRETGSEYAKQSEYFERISNELNYTVRLGELRKSSKKEPFRQKGVDIRMAIDALAKAYQNHYDHGVFMVGDTDFIPLIEAVKDAGKKTLLLGLCPANFTKCPPDLMRVFDQRIYIGFDDIKSWMEK